LRQKTGDLPGKKLFRLMVSASENWEHLQNRNGRNW
jgi:hypothetical protein